MKPSLIVTTALSLMAMSPNIFAGEVFPVVSPKCNVAIVQPDEAAGYYLNKDCTAAFVLPQRSGLARVEAIHQINNLAMCPGLAKAYKKVDKYQDMAEKFLEQLEKNPSMPPAQADSIRKNIEAVNAQKKDLFEPYDLVPAATVQMSYTMPQTNAWISKWTGLNQNTMVDKGLRFYPAPTSDGFLAFSALDQAKVKIKLSPIVQASIPGMRPVESDPAKFVGTAVVANGDMSAQIVLSLAGVCNPDGNKPPLTTEKGIAANLIVNSTFTVPVMADVGYSASLNTDLAIENWTKRTEYLTQFSKAQFADLVSKGSAGQAFTLNIVNYGGYDSSLQDKENFHAKLREEVLTRLAGNLVSQMEASGFLEMSEPPPAIGTPAPGTVDETRTRTECRRSSGFLGIGARSRCTEIPYVVKIPRGSEGTLVLSKINDTTFTNREVVTMNQIVHRVHTGTYWPEK